MFKEKLDANGIIYQQAITSGRKFGNIWASKRNDIFGAFDFEIATKDGEIIFIQITSASNASARKKKVYDNFISKLDTTYIYYNIYVLSYKDKKQKGRKKKITLWHLSKYNIGSNKWSEISLNYNNSIDKWYDLDTVIKEIRIVYDVSLLMQYNTLKNIKRKNNNLKGG